MISVIENQEAESNIYIPLACESCEEPLCRFCRVFLGYIRLYAKLLDTEEERKELAKELGIGYKIDDEVEKT